MHFLADFHLRDSRVDNVVPIFRFEGFLEGSGEACTSVHPSFLDLSGDFFSEGFLINPSYSQLLLFIVVTCDNDESYITCR